MERLFKRPWIVVAVIAALTALFALQLPRAELDNNNFRFVPEGDPARVAAHRIDETFGSQVVILVGLERRRGTVLDADFIERLREFGGKVEALGAVDSVESLATADYIGGSAWGIVVERLVPEDFRGTPEELALVRDRLLEWDLYRRALVSDDFRSTQVAVTMDVSADKAGSPEAVGAYRAVRRLADEAGFPDTRVHVTGLPAFSAAINEAMTADLRFLIPLVAIAVAGVLFLSFRKPGGIVLPILTVAISADWSLGLMTLLGYKLSILATMLPVILVAVGSAYCIHVISHYYDEAAGDRALTPEEHRGIVLMTLRRYGKPVSLAAFTDGTGFLALCFTPVVPIREFGMFAAFGILVAFLVAMTLIPALLLIRGPAKPDRPARPAMVSANVPAASKATSGDAAGLAGRRDGADDPLSRAIADRLLALARRRGAVVAIGAIVVALSVAGVLRLVIDNVLVEYFRKDAEIAIADEFIRANFGGSKEVSVVARGARAGDVLRPDILAAMDGLSSYLAAEVPEVGKTIGFADFVKRVNQVFNADEGPADAARAGGAYYEIPTDPARYGKKDTEELKALIGNYLVLLSSDISAFADDPLEPRSIRLGVQLRTVGQRDTNRAIDAIRAYAAARFPKDAKVEIGGSALVEESLNNLVVVSQLSSLPLSLLMVFVTLALFYRSAVAGLVGIAPLALSILVDFGVMGAVGIKLNIGTAMVASIAVGVGIDYTIHYLAAYHRECLRAKGSGDFLRRTFLTSGKAILFNAASVGLGFAVLALSRFAILAELGILMALAMLTSALVSLTLLPALLEALKPAFIRRPLPFERTESGTEAPL